MSETQKSLVAKAHRARQLKLESNIAAASGWRSVSASDDRTASPDATLEAGDEWDILWRRIERLDARERTILVLRYGLEGETPLTLKEIGRRLGVTREWVRKIEVRAVRKLDGNYESDPDIVPAPSARPRRSAARSRPAQITAKSPVRGPGPLRSRARSHSFAGGITRAGQPSPAVAAAL